MRRALDDLGPLIRDGFDVEEIRSEPGRIRVRLARGRLRVNLDLDREDAHDILVWFRLRPPQP